MIRLSVQDGSIYQTVTLETDKVFLGRMKSNTIPLNDESVSRKHCIIRHTSEGSVEVLDLNSRNGTKWNGESVERATLAEGDELQLGEVKVKIEALVGSPVASEPPAGNGEPPDSDRVKILWKVAEDEEKQVPARETKVLISQAHHTSFSEELFRHLRRTPWWAASVLLHTVLIYVMFLVPFRQAPPPTPVGRVDGDLRED
ncbi:MAG: FHA domain-containing protein, partial [Planctomycetota bacterium]